MFSSGQCFVRRQTAHSASGRIHLLQLALRNPKPLSVCHPWVFGCLRRRLAAAAKQATEIEAPNLRDLGSGRRAEASSPDNRVGGGANRSRPRAYTKLAWVRASRFPDAEFGGVLLEAGSATHDRG